MSDDCIALSANAKEALTSSDNFAAVTAFASISAVAIVSFDAKAPVGTVTFTTPLASGVKAVPFF